MGKLFTRKALFEKILMTWAALIGRTNKMVYKSSLSNFLNVFRLFNSRCFFLCRANSSNSVDNKIAFFSQRKQLKRFDSSFTCGDAIYEVLLFLYSSPYQSGK